MEGEHRVSVTPGSDGLAAGIDDVNRRLRAVLAHGDGFRRRKLPRTWTPPPMPCVGRDDELADLRAALTAGRRHVCVHGPRGMGKTTLLYRAATLGILAADTMPDCEGVLWPRRGFRFADDLLRDLFADCYHAKPNAVVPDETVRRLLRPINALVVLDHLALPDDELRAVVEAMPDSRFVLTAARPDPPGFAHVLPLGGLSLDNGVRALADRLDEPLAEDDVHHLAAVWEDYEGHPGRLAGLAGYLRTVGRRGTGVRVPTPEELPLVVPRVVAELDPSARATLEVLAAVPDAEWGAGLLARVSDTAEKLGARRLVRHSLVGCPDGRRYRLGPYVHDHLPAGFPTHVAEIAARLTVWLHETARPVPVAAETDVIERTLEATLAEGDHLAALLLARAASVVLVNSAAWSAWRRILTLGLRAARAVGSVRDELYFTYGLAAWATANQRTDEAVRLLDLVIGASQDSGENYAAEQAAEWRGRIEDAAWERTEIVPPVAVHGLVAQLARVVPGAFRTAKPRLGQLPGVQAVLRFTAENPVVVRVAAGLVAAAIAAAATVLALPHPGTARSEAIPTPGTSRGPGARPVFGASPAPTGTRGSAPGNAPGGSGGGGAPAALPGDPGGGSGGPAAVLPGSFPTTTAAGEPAPGPSTTSPFGPPPPPIAQTWGFWRVRYTDDPPGTTRDIGPSAKHNDNGEANWTYGQWRMRSPPSARKPTVTHLATGRFSVLLPDVGEPGGITQVTALDFNSVAVSCQPVGWARQGTDETATVDCFNRSGSLADEPFSGLFLGGNADTGPTRGYVYANQPTMSSYLPVAHDRDNAGPVTRLGVGRYSVALDGPTGTVQVSPVDVEQRHCVVVGRPTNSATVTCVRHDGSAVDTRFVLSYTNRQSLLDDARRPHAAELRVDADATVERQWTSKPGAVTVTHRKAVGEYQINLPVGLLPSYTHVSAVNGGYCTLVLLNDYSKKDESLVYVSCFTPAGAPADEGFHLTYMTASPYE
jgi:hypothetical protein